MKKEVISNIVREVLREKGLLDHEAHKPASKRIPHPHPTPAVLNVFHPGVRKLEQALEQISLIEDIAAKSSVFTVDSARTWVCGQDVRDKSGCKCILDSVKPDGIEKALCMADILILPTFCFKTAAKVAQLINDNQETAIVISALMKGKPVLAANDGFTLLDTLSNRGIREEINRILSKLEGFGMVFCETEQLAGRFKNLAASLQRSSETRDQNDSNIQKPQAFRLITAKDIQIAVNNKQRSISLAPGGIITPLAKDQAREYAVKIVRS